MVTWNSVVIMPQCPSCLFYLTLSYSCGSLTVVVVLQGLIHRGMSPRDMQQGWDVALTPTHLAVTLPTRVAAVYQLQVCRPTVSLPVNSSAF